MCHAWLKLNKKENNMATKSLEDLVKDAIENLILNGELIVEDNEGNQIEDLSINIKKDEEDEDFDNEDGEEDEDSASEDDEDEE